eukprot:jgi/Botrbrau1/14875/Bobra.0298s0008.1
MNNVFKNDTSVSTGTPMTLAFGKEKQKEKKQFYRDLLHQNTLTGISYLRRVAACIPGADEPDRTTAV